MEPGADASAKAAKGPPPPPPPPALGARQLWRLSNLLMAIFFGLAGAVQVNDPDPGLWIVAYSVPAALSLVVCLNPPIADNIVWRSLSDLHSAACVVGSAILGCSLFANAQKNILHEEEGRFVQLSSYGWYINRTVLCMFTQKELFGLVIVTVWMSFCRSSTKNSLGGIRLALAVSFSLFPFITWLYIYVHAEMRASWPSHCKTVI